MAGETFVHPLAAVEPGAEIGVGARIGPFCVVGAKAVIGDRVELFSHVSVTGTTTIGAGTRVWAHTALGGPAQSTHEAKSPTSLTIGANCRIRENVTMNAGSDAGGGRTVVGDNGYFMSFSHVAHDCTVGNNVTFANSATLAGHCEVGDNVVIGGLTAVHQFSRIGRGAFLSGCSAVPGDVIPFGLARGNLAKLKGLNVVGMRRAGDWGGVVMLGNARINDSANMTGSTGTNHMSLRTASWRSSSAMLASRERVPRSYWMPLKSG